MCKIFKKKCKHPTEYRQGMINIPTPPKGTYVYWYSLCKEIYTVVEKVKKEMK